jgi:hypothetical protein
MTKRSMANISPRFVRKQFAWRTAGRIPGTKQSRFLLFAGRGIDCGICPADPDYVCIVVDQLEKRLFIDGGMSEFGAAWARANAIVMNIEQERIK